MEEFLTTREAADQKGVALATIYEAVKRGDLASTKVLGRIGIKPIDLDAYQAGSYNGIERTRKRRGPRKGQQYTQRLVLADA